MACSHMRSTSVGDSDETWCIHTSLDRGIEGFSLPCESDGPVLGGY